ncbi:MAG: recombinase family protein [Oscillospiraceae bacterium]|nr:recombinase family protein [Oscillospiraceae bacterium]
MKKTYRAAKYIRTSTPDDELQHRDSIANQSKLIDRFLQTHPEIIVATEKIDSGYSGLFYDRPAFNEMIADIKAGDVDCVVVKDLSRLGRNYIETGKCLRDLFQPNGVRFISIDDNIDSIQLDGVERTIALIKNIFSEQYSHDISKKTRSSLNAKRRQGAYVGAVPIYGYQRSDSNKYKLAIDLNTYPIVQSIFHMKLQGLSAAKIASELNNSGVLSPIAYKREQGLPHSHGGFADNQNAHWSATTILRILRDENYTGTLVQGRLRQESYKSKALRALNESEWSRIEEAHPPIISKVDYSAVQRALAIDTRTAPKCRGVHIFSGLLICGCCGSNMTRKSIAPAEQSYIYYYCPTGKKRGCTSPHMVRDEALLAMVTLAIKERLASIEGLTRNLSVAHIVAVAKNECAQQLAEHIQSINDLQKFRSSLYSSLACGLIGATEFQLLQKHYSHKISLQENEISSLQNKLYCATESSSSNELAWTYSFLQFIDSNELNRFSVVKMVQHIRVLAKNKIAIDFVHQREYEQLARYIELRGRNDG